MSNVNASAGAADAPLPATYELAMAELEDLVGSMEDGSLSLDAMLASYRRGAKLLAFCRARLEQVEQQVSQLENGELKPFLAEF
ncbi:MAG: exodeoxyribonuclease VII small subunit [Planctomycetota bacterium]|nr:exodeoxyribonuclease VII small subunit [Planctomycetota bacterium]